MGREAEMGNGVGGKLGNKLERYEEGESNGRERGGNKEKEQVKGRCWWGNGDTLTIKEEQIHTLNLTH